MVPNKPSLSARAIQSRVSELPSSHLVQEQQEPPPSVPEREPSLTPMCVLGAAVNGDNNEKGMTTNPFPPKDTLPTRRPASSLTASRPLSTNLHQTASVHPGVRSDHERYSENVATRPPSPSPLNKAPVLLNQLGAADGESILVVVVEDESADVEHHSTGIKRRGARIYGGSQSGDIHVWDLTTLTLRAHLSGHDSAVLSLQLVPSRSLLFSSSRDGTIRVWHTPTLSALYLIHPLNDNVGDILSLAWVNSDQLTGGDCNLAKRTPFGRLFAGCQDTCIQWIDLAPVGSETSHPHVSLPPHLSSPHLSPGSNTPPIHKTPNKFFDSLGLQERPRSRLARTRNSNSGTSLASLAREFDAEQVIEAEVNSHVVELQFEQHNTELYAHFGYVYCLAVGKSNDQHVLISGSGDEQVKVWLMQLDGLRELAVLPSTADAVLTLAVRESTVFAGHQGGVIRVWDLDTLTCIRDLHPHKHDILTISVLDDEFFSGASDGSIQRWDKSFHPIVTWRGHERTVLSSAVSSSDGKRLFTGGNDALIKIWDVVDDHEPVKTTNVGFQGQLFHTLSKLVSFRTIADDEHREECRQGALYLKRLLQDLGATAALLPSAAGKNPIVMATFASNATSNSSQRKRVLCYGHYDVVAAEDTAQWSHDPFDMIGKDGWVYGRGVSDNKGPMLAIAAAASELRSKQALGVDVVILIEGEEEAGSAGFQDAVRRNRDTIGNVDVILVSNSYWIGEDIPCLTYGLRGVIHVELTIKSSQPDLHSGMQGGDVSEPLVDMARLLASLIDSDGRVCIPGFLDDVRQMSSEEAALYDSIVERCNCGKEGKSKTSSLISDSRQSMIARWRQPALSIHKIDVSGPPQKTLIPSWASSSVSIRIVPDQSLLSIVEQLKAHLHKSFSHLRTCNVLSVDISHVADWWLGEVESEYYKAFADCIEAEWGTKPLFIREGGSIPSLPFLEREFGADAVHFPMGLSSDAAHLSDERIPVVNLERGKAVVGRFLSMIGQQHG